MVRAAPIALGVSCTALALLLSLRGEEPVPPRIVRERHQYHQPVPPQASHAAALPTRLPSPPDIPTSRRDDAPLPAACVPGRLCATPQLRPHTAGGASHLLSRTPPPLDLSSAGRRQAAPAVVPHTPVPHTPVPQAPEPHTRTPALPSGAAMLRVRAAAWLKCPPWQCPSSPPVPPQSAPGGSGQLGTPRVEAGPRGAQCLRCSS